MKKILKIIRTIIEYLYYWVIFMGLIFVTLLVIGSIYTLKTGLPYHYNYDLGLFVKDSTMAWFWIACWISFALHLVISLVNSIKKRIDKYKQSDKKGGIVDILKEIIKN